MSRNALWKQRVCGLDRPGRSSRVSYNDIGSDSRLVLPSKWVRRRFTLLLRLSMIQ
jgi:hypothetical protein